MFLFAMIGSSRKIHRNMMASLLHASLNEFYDRIPIGRILNRFSKDLINLDEKMSFTLSDLSVCAFFVIGDLAICVYTTTIYLFIPIFVFSIGSFYF